MGGYLDSLYVHWAAGDYAAEEPLSAYDDLVAYLPLARGDAFDIPELTDVAEKHGVSQAQLSLAWLRSKENVVAIPKATSEAHIAENWASLDLELDEADLTAINGIEWEDRHLDFDMAPWNQWASQFPS